MSGESPPFVPAELPAGAKFAVAAARFNASIVDELLEGCLSRFAELGMDASRVAVFRVPGAFELPTAAKALAQTGRYAAVVCLGCVIRGETAHFELVAGECARGIQQVAIEAALPVIFGVLTTETRQQALDRAGGRHGHAGRQAAEAAVEMAGVMGRVRRTDHQCATVREADPT
jgi:6,7-dimethyl-8-ribityllumazine synthase